MQSDMIDLVFGRPLVQEIDFELPFGGAVFRHVRTFSRQVQRSYEPWGDIGFWDWNGHGWMMGEAPILLIDAQVGLSVDGSFDNIVSIVGTDVHTMPERRCVLVPDAHHAIPFILQQHGQEYEYVAPSWFDATFEHDGVVGSNGFESAPTYIDVWLSRQRIRYRFTPHFNEDLNPVPTEHAPPPTGRGAPYYGLLAYIEDRAGNRIQPEYCGFHEYETGCSLFGEEIYQTCNQKGQLKSVRLIPAGSSDPEWTLIYYFQNLQCSEDDCPPQETAHFRHHLRSVFVYEGDVTDADGLDCLTLPLDTFCNTNALSGWDHPPYLGIPDNWVIQAEYTYSEDFVAPPFIAWDVSPTNPGSNTRQRGSLIRTVVRRRAEVGDVPSEQTTLYRYSEWPGAGGPASHVPGLKAIYSPAAVDRMIEAARTVPCDGGSYCANYVDADVNYLIGLNDYYYIRTADPATGAMTNIPVEDFATHYFEYVLPTDFQRRPLFRDLASAYGLGGTDGTINDRYTNAYTDAPVQLYRARTGNPSYDGDYYFYFMRLAVDTIDLEAGEEYCSNPLRADNTSWDAHVPYYVAPYGLYPTCGAHIPRADRVRHVAVVDRVEPSTKPLWELASGSKEYSGLLSRRVVEMNAASFVLREREFDYEESNGALLEQHGYAAQRRYNAKGQLIEIRSEGWGSEENIGHEDTDGLIHFFEYGACGQAEPGGPTNPRLAFLYSSWRPGEPKELACTGLMLGTNGARWYTAKYEHGIPAQPELVTREFHFRTPVDSAGIDSPAPSGHHVIKRIHDYAGGDPAHDEVRYVVEMIDTGQEAPGSAGDHIWSLKRTRYDLHGAVTSNGIGRFVASGNDPADPPVEDLLEFYVDTHTFNNRGQLLQAVLDADVAASDQFTRVAHAALPPLELETTYTYDTLGRVVRVDKPGGLSDRTVYDQWKVIDSEGLRETWMFQDVAADGSVEKPVQVMRLTSQGQPIEVLSVRVATFSEHPDCDASCTVLSSSKLNYDVNGRVDGAEGLADTSTDGSAVVASIAYDAFGQVGREQAPDGTIVRTVRSMRGMVEKVYRGSNDEHPFWATATYCTNPNPAECDYPNDEFPDDMVLVEKHFYGEGVRDAGLVRELRRYNQKPLNQYFEEGEEPGQFPPNDENSNGLRTVYSYDCRMRPVLVEEQDAEGTPLFRTFTWYDHLDRPRIVAEYDADDGPPAALDPRVVCYFGAGATGYPADAIDGAPESPDVPWARSIRDASATPLSLREMIYNAAGQMAEERDYRIDPEGPLHYTSTFYEFDGRGLTVLQRSPSGGTTKSLYNALGQLVLQRKIVETAAAESGEIEVRRTLNTYDPLGNLIVEITYERRASAGVNASFDYPQDDAAILQYRHYWYDRSNRLTATAEYGTNNASDYFENGPAPTREVSPPLGTSVLITQYEYDDAGRQYRVTDPAGLVTETEYDDLGRQVLVSENAAWLNGEPPRQTAYRYEKSSGRLVEVAALNGTTATDYAAIDWNATDGSIQITRYDYDAPIVNLDSTGAIVYVSTNGGWISAVHYPDPETGQPEAEPSLRFAYRHDGQVAQRIDARGVELDYQYDARDRLESIRVASFGANVASNAVKLEYAYTPSGMLRDAYVRNGSGEILNHVNLTYDSNHEVATVTQQVGDGPQRTTTFDWAWSNAAGDTRLTGITYPHPNAPQLEYLYGGPYATDGLDDALSRTTHLMADEEQLAQWWYMGDSRRMGQVIGGHVQTFGDPAWKLDRFGRIRQFEYTNASGTALRHVYGYDRSGNRTFNYTYNANTDHSWQYRYDSLSRLVSASRGAMDLDGTFLPGTQPLTTTWALDTLGNWSGDENEESVHRFRDADADGEFSTGDTTLSIDHHDVSAANEIDWLLTVDAFGSNGAQPYAYDLAGNLIFDGERYFTYDAWNRLAGIYATGTLYVDDYGDLTGTAGDCIEWFEYDALGRRVRTELHPGTEAAATTEHVYGTGAAVLEEYIGTTGAQTLARWFIHGESFPDPLYMIDLTAAGDIGAGTEEWLYYLKDALGSVMALVSLDTGAVVERYAYDPYGRTEVLVRFAVEYLGGPVEPAGDYFYHDHDFDGDVDAADAADLLACVGSNGPRCVFFHDRNGDGVVTALDVTLMQQVYGGVGEPDQPPPAGHARPNPQQDLVAAGAEVTRADAGGLQACFASSDGWCVALYDADASGTVDLSDVAR
ncbi:MAG: RHS repeat protein, partial [Phycisphaerales bacterium]|nr:RHS repeat protein [Phycisphaerales bacterium]